MESKKILVIGASGFIATYLIDELLRQGHHVTAADISDVGREYYQRKKIDYFNIDITKASDFDVLVGKKYDVVVHLAACQPANVGQAKYDARDYINVNVIGTLNVLEFCRQKQVEKIIYASSHRNTQGLWSASKAIREEDGREIKYSGEYAMFSISESAAQDCVLHYQAQFNLNGIIFRLPPVYGYGPHTEIYMDGKPIKTGFQIFIENAQACRPLEIWGSADVGRDIIYVKDVVSAFVKAIDMPKVSGLFNITSGNYLTLRAQAQTIAQLFWGSTTQPVIIERPELSNGMDSFLYDNSKAMRELDWSPKYQFKDMLIDYKIEMESKRYEYLLNKRQTMFQST
jgi:UDP-glucose 4-epimerase